MPATADHVRQYVPSPSIYWIHVPCLARRDATGTLRFTYFGTNFFYRERAHPTTTRHQRVICLADIFLSPVVSITYLLSQQQAYPNMAAMYVYHEAWAIIKTRALTSSLLTVSNSTTSISTYPKSPGSAGSPRTGWAGNRRLAATPSPSTAATSPRPSGVVRPRASRSRS